MWRIWCSLKYKLGQKLQQPYGKACKFRMFHFSVFFFIRVTAHVGRTHCSTDLCNKQGPIKTVKTRMSIKVFFSCCIGLRWIFAYPIESGFRIAITVQRIRYVFWCSRKDLELHTGVTWLESPPENRLTLLRFSPIPSWRYRKKCIKEATTASFQILSNQSFITLGYILKYWRYCRDWTFYSLLVTGFTNKLNILTTARSAHTVIVFCICLRTNSDLCHLHNKLIGFYNRDEKCLQRGTDGAFKWSSLGSVF
jgi:hypothetical protein